MASARPKPVLLAILDGWGHTDPADDNAITKADTPNWDHFLKTYPHGLVSASAKDVGLPEGQMGNSEVGHMNIGAGRIVMQDLPRIDQAIASGDLAKNSHLLDGIRAIRSAPEGTHRCHLMGLLSPGGVHSHQHHMLVLAKILADAGVHVLVHVFLDGRDTPPQSALEYLEEFETHLEGYHERVQIATVSGRYYAMDRDKRWDRVEKAYAALVSGKGEHAGTAKEAITQSYAKSVTDEFILPTVIGQYEGMRDTDGFLMANFRADRARQLLTALTDNSFDGFERTVVPNFSARLGMVEYSSALANAVTSLFPNSEITGTLGEVVADAGLTQLRIAETEKYAHVTFFFNAGQEKEFAGEERILVPSPKVATYDLQPEMSAFEVTENIEKAIASEAFDLIVVNYANPDMVGHTGKMDAAITAVETVDQCLGRLATAVLNHDGAMLITADHGNIEHMQDDSTHQPHTAHTTNLVPLVAVYRPWSENPVALPQGRLCDIAPSLLALLGIDQPSSMTGRSLLSGLTHEGR